jgi:hypothetical protein
MEQLKTILTIVCALSMQTVFAFRGSINFTPSEKANHLADIERLGRATKNCMYTDINKHRRWIKDYGISAFYGDQSKFGQIYYMKDREKKLKSMGKDPKLARQMKPTSCVGFVLKCLGEGFKASGQEDLWEKIRKFTKKNDQRGDALIHSLQKLGWKVLYWNPKPSKNKSWDSNEKIGTLFASGAYQGHHEARYQSVMKKNRYYFNKVDNKTALVNFGRKVPEPLKVTPFYVGLSHTGYHVYAGEKGRIYESHSSRKITDKKTLEANHFNPLKWKYKSGLLAVPPTYYGNFK